MLYKLTAYLFHGMVKGKVFNISVCERAARGSWKSPEWKEISRWNTPSRSDLATREARTELVGGIEREGKKKTEQP